ncbi:DUF389 domain-containing protein [Euzebya sp.]|uniref:DUF389 domain-containing protein n=1 Tax=Euzebya sp. TaxID=1971409 RepID=UPI003517BFC5
MSASPDLPAPDRPLPEEPDQALQPVPDHAHTVVVPIANPDTAVELLALARALVRRDGGRVIALVVVLGDADAEANLDRTEAVEAIVDTARARDGRTALEVVTRPASSIARGILDTAREERADLVVLGVQAPTPGGVAIGGITEPGIAAAAGDVLVYRRGLHGRGLESIEGITIGVDGSADARVAARTGMILAEGLTLPAAAIHVQPRGEDDDTAARTLDSALRGLDGEERCRRRVVQATTAAEGLCEAVPPSHLAVVGFHTTSDLTGSRLGRTTRRTLDALRGPVLAISRPQRLSGPEEAVRRVVRHLRPRLTEAEEQSLVWHARLDAIASTDFVVLSVVSAMLATLGLLLDSAAVIIGAMLVAPLISPLVAFGTAMVDGDVRTLRRAAATSALGSVLVALTAAVIGVLAGPDAATQEMLSRGSPSILDAGVAAASGVIGGYASARRGIPAALAGVAIAAALVPPICVFGLALTLDVQLAIGSGLLFVTNITFIAVAAAGVLLWLGVRLEPTGRRRTRYVRLTAPVMGIVMLALATFGLASRGPDLTGIGRDVSEALGGVEVVAVEGSRRSEAVTVTIRTAEVPAEAALTDAVAAVEAAHGVAVRVAHQPLLVD